MQRLTENQVEALRRLPADDRPNKLRLAMALADVTQGQLVEATGLAQPYVSDVVRGRFRTITVDNARKFAEFFGCQIEDLFPRREGAAA